MRHLLAAALAVGSSAGAQAERPLFSFGVVADAQYADQDPVGPRSYRESLAKAEKCAAALAREKPAFVIQLGDLVDGGAGNLERMLRLWEQFPKPRYHVLGNHDFVGSRDTLLERLRMPAAYYDFGAHGWRFIVLDGMNVSVAGGWAESDPHARAGAELLAVLKNEGVPNAQTWNGAIGREQRDWLRRALAAAARKKRRAIVFCHFPVLAESCRPEHLLWDHAEVLAILESQPAVVSYMSGHDHRGGYAFRKEIHHVTFPGMVEGDSASSCRVVDAFSDRLEVRSAGQRGPRGGDPPLILRIRSGVSR